MRIRRLRADELATFVDDLWLPFAREMATIDDFDTLAEQGVRQSVNSYVADRFSDDDIATHVADDTGIVGYVTVEKRSLPPCSHEAHEGTSMDYTSCRTAAGSISHPTSSRAEEWARRRGCDHLSLDVHAENQVAWSLYENGEFATKRHRMTKRL